MDGWRRNWRKLQEEWRYTKKRTGEHWERWAKKPWDLHAYVNLYVETRRASPYLMGHIDSVLYPALVGACLYLFFTG